ncbi:MAG TPA: ABC transporter substrate-binding protein [Kofleriaceae bacterium]|nr:ABC transporter substrate-binding protein [Kofleriaceae bacterium]
MRWGWWLLLLPLGCDLGGVGGERDGRRASSADRRDPGTVVVGRPADALSLDPGRVTDNESAEVTEQIYEPLLHYRPGSNRIEPGLAERWEMSKDGRVWTFHLRDHVRFHDGTPLDAAAVVFSLERQRDVNHPFHRPDKTNLKFAYWENLYKNIRSIEAVSRLVVRITIDRHYAPFEANMAMFPVAIVSPTAVEEWGEEYYQHPIGTGPFRFSEWEAGRIVLERNADYWGEPPAVERLVFRAIPDGRQRLIELESGAVDLAYSIVPDELQFVELHPDLQLFRAAANNIAYLAMNSLRPPFDDVRVRRAVNHAVNKQPIVKLAYQGLATPARGPLPPTQWGHNADLATYEYDADKARLLLAAAAADGHYDPNRTYNLYVPSTPRPYLPNPEQVARVIQANLAAVGMKVDLVVQGMKAHIEDAQRGEHDLTLFGWVGDNGDPDNFLYMLLDQDNTTLGVARNVAFFRHPALHELLMQAQQSMERDVRERIYFKAQDIIAAEAPWVPLAHTQVAVAARIDVGGVVVNPSTHVDFRGVRRLGR